MAQQHMVKVSMYLAKAKDTARHNDRSLYKHGYERRDENVHYDLYNMGSSHDAEMRFYEEEFGDTLSAQNERARANYHPESVMNMTQYRLKHMPQEAIIQIGTRDDYQAGLVDDSYCQAVIPQAVKTIEDAGGKVISWDLHNDETAEDDELVDDITQDEAAEEENPDYTIENSDSDIEETEGIWDYDATDDLSGIPEEILNDDFSTTWDDDLSE